MKVKRNSWHWRWYCYIQKRSLYGSAPPGLTRWRYLLMIFLITVFFIPTLFAAIFIYWIGTPIKNYLNKEVKIVDGKRSKSSKSRVCKT